MKPIKQLLLLSVAGLLVSACASPQSEEKMNYRDSIVTPTLEIPPDLLSRNGEKNLTLPGSRIGTAQNAGRYIETGNQAIEVNVLPVLSDFQIVGEGDLYWLEVAMPAEQLYPLIKAYWQEQGFELIKDEPLIGLMETEWLGYKAGKKSILASIVASLRAAESRDQYRTRIERFQDKTKVFVSHRGQELVIDDTSESYKVVDNKQGWQFVPPDTFKEVEMLSRLMISLGMQDEKVKQELEKVGKFEPRAYLEIDETEDGKEMLLMVKQGYQQTWNRLRYRMQQLGIGVTVKERFDDSASINLDFQGMPETGYKLDLVTAAKPQLISLEAVSNTNVTRIEIVKGGDGSTKDPAARQLLNFLLEQLR